jgi:hypothetical protein
MIVLFQVFVSAFCSILAMSLEFMPAGRNFYEDSSWSMLILAVWSTAAACPILAWGGSTLPARREGHKGII